MTSTRAVSGLSRLAMARASSSRPLPTLEWLAIRAGENRQETAGDLSAPVPRVASLENVLRLRLGDCFFQSHRPGGSAGIGRLKLFDFSQSTACTDRGHRACTDVNHICQLNVRRRAGPRSVSRSDSWSASGSGSAFSPKPASSAPYRSATSRIDAAPVSHETPQPPADALDAADRDVKLIGDFAGVCR